MKVHGHRSLLNQTGFGSTAAIVAEIENSESWKPGCDREGTPLKDSGSWGIMPDVNLAISDCSRQISFDSPETNDPESWDNFLFKIDTMIEALTALKKGAEIERKRFETRKEIWDKRPKKDEDEAT